MWSSRFVHSALRMNDIKDNINKDSTTKPGTLIILLVATTKLRLPVVHFFIKVEGTIRGDVGVSKRGPTRGL